MTERLRIAVLGMIVRFPAGGLTWHYLHYVLGFAELGHDVRFVETSGDWASCWNPQTNEMETDPAFGTAYAKRVFSDVGISRAWMYFDQHSDTWLGPSAPDAGRWMEDVDLLVNVSGVTPMLDCMIDVPVRALIDTDPGFTQIRNLESVGAADYARLHNRFLSFGGLVLEEECSVPKDGLPWIPTRQPIVLKHWPIEDPRPAAPFTTVMQWTSYEPVRYGDVELGMKADSFAVYEDLPGLVTEDLAMAVSRLPASERSRLEALGWHLHDPRVASSSPGLYRRYLSGSKGEFTVAKDGYVKTRSGWFSERSANYLAAGRPVITQDTGFSTFLPSDLGLVSFESLSEAVDAIGSVAGDYQHHCRAARDIAVEYFDSSKVFARMLDDVGPDSGSGATVGSDV